jgi:hypothetical protein
MSSRLGRFRLAVPLAALLACGDNLSGPDDAPYAPVGPCDADLANDSESATDAAKSMGICDGLVLATWVYPDGTAAPSSDSFHKGHDILPYFGRACVGCPNQRNMPREGSALLAITSGRIDLEFGFAYAAGSDKGYVVTPPAGFPNHQPGCPQVSSQANDGIGLAVTLIVPEGARFMTFQYAYFTGDYPVRVCTQFVDQAAALFTGIGESSTAENVLLDAEGNPMLASPTALLACKPPTPGYSCPLGSDVLTETALAAGSGWLTATRAVTPGRTIDAIFTIWDSHDGNGFYDSTLLLDGFAWLP